MNHIYQVQKLSNFALLTIPPDSDKEDSAADPMASVFVVPKQMSSALGSLVANYGSSSGSESDSEPEGELKPERVAVTWQSKATLLFLLFALCFSHGCPKNQRCSSRKPGSTIRLRGHEHGNVFTWDRAKHWRKHNKRQKRTRKSEKRKRKRKMWWETTRHREKTSSNST